MSPGSTCYTTGVTDAPQLIARFHTTLDLWDAGVAIYRQTLRRVNPSASEREVDQLLQQWLQHRPGAEMGDGPPPSRVG